MFTPYKVQVGDFAVEWEYIGEGYWGEYNPEEPEDAPLLRASLSYKGEDCNDGSYCTLAFVTTPLAELKLAAEELVCAVKVIGHDRDGPEFNRRVMELWTWRTYDKGHP